MTELIKCECGDRPTIQDNKSLTTAQLVIHKYSVKCHNCGKETMKFLTIDDAINRWNVQVKRIKKGSTKLLNCPFCGGKAKILDNRTTRNPYVPCCSKCECILDWYHTKAEAIEAWNRREK